MMQNVNWEEEILIDRYLDSQLSGIELLHFMDRLENDPAFRQIVSFQNLLQEGIRKASDLKLRSNIIGAIKYRQPWIPLGLKLIITFLFVMGAGIVIWNYTGKDSSGTDKKLFSLSFFRRHDDAKKDENKSQSQNGGKDNSVAFAEKKTGSKSLLPAAESEESQRSGKSVPETAIPAVDSSEKRISGDQNITIRKDQLLISYSLPVIEEPEDNLKNKDESSPSTSLGKSTLEKLNPEAGLAKDAEKFPDTYELEFWISPVNYKGYKMSRNKLILFGIEEPDVVKLYRVEGRLIMKCGNEFYRIVPAEDFSSYHQLKESEIPESWLK